jgi:hypothetical protein
LPLIADFIVYEYGAAVLSPSFVDPLKNSTFFICPSGSLAFAFIVISAPVVNFAPYGGDAIEITGGKGTTLPE